MYLPFCAPFKKTTHCRSSHRSKSTKYLWSQRWLIQAWLIECDGPMQLYIHPGPTVCIPLLKKKKKGGGGFSTSHAIFSRPFFVMPVKSATLALISCESGTVSMWHRNSWFPALRPLPHLLRGRSAVSDGWQSGGSTMKQEKSCFYLTLFSCSYITLFSCSGGLNIYVCGLRLKKH